jgi:predicted nuclease of predicted toxin-antitoxin system
VKLLADENFPPSLIAILQKKRHDVKRIQRTTRGISDMSLRLQASKENRTIITFDRDFLKAKHGEEAVSVMLFSFPDFKRTEEKILKSLPIYSHK